MIFVDWASMKKLSGSGGFWRYIVDEQGTINVFNIQEGLSVGCRIRSNQPENIADFNENFKWFIDSQIKLLLVKGQASTVDGVARVLFAIPPKRQIEGGMGMFQNQSIGDWLEIDIVDDYGNVLGTFSDPDMPAANRGWYLLDGPLQVKPMINQGPANLIPGYFLRLTGYKADLSNDNLFVNLKWGYSLV